MLLLLPKITLMKFLLLNCLLIIRCIVAAQQPPEPFGPAPSDVQLHWQEMEMYCIIHFSMGTYTDKEWGMGSEKPSIFNPQDFDAKQIVGAAKAGGFKGVVIVAKHHDGFCLWPTKTTMHNISESPYKNGKGDIVREYRNACDELGMQMGIYCSPWDRNNAAYGSPAYVDIYRRQIGELYSAYGPLFISWHDGANGGDGYYGGAKEVRKIDRTSYYGWDTTWALVRKLQPTAAIFGDVGPDVRWVGNERGEAGVTCWATYTPEAPDAGRRPANGYVKDIQGTEGHRNGRYWMPAECDVPLRPGWFYHQSEDGKSKTVSRLLDLYYKSVGRGAALDLGLSPDKRGLIAGEDVKILTAFGDVLRKTFSENLAKSARFATSEIRGNDAADFGPGKLTDEDRYSYWATNDSTMTAEFVADLGEVKTFNVVRLRENIKLGQRIDSFAVDVRTNNHWMEIGGGTSIGGNRLLRLPGSVQADKVRVRIVRASACVALSDFGLFKEPE
jgi:alpha-L-fucosidase